MATVDAANFGFNVNDATAALQAAIDSGADKVIVSDRGSPWLISNTIRLRSNQEIEFAPGVVVRAKSGSFLSNINPLFLALDVNNIKLTGQGIGTEQATLAMNRDEYTDPNNQNAFAHIIAIAGVDNYTISGLTLTGAGGDGIFIDGYSYGQAIPVPGKLNYSDRGSIDNVTVTDNRRNGMSVISAQNLTVTNSKFTNAIGANPSAGIDFEPDFSYQRLSNINLSNVYLSNNYGDGLTFSLQNLDNSSNPIGVTVNGATIDNNGSSGILVGTYTTPSQPDSNNPSSTVNGVINISNVTIAGTKGTNVEFDRPLAAIAIEALSGDLSDPNNLKVNFTNVAISDTNFNVNNPTLSAAPILVRGFGGASDRREIGNLSFNNVTVADDFNRSIIKIESNRNDGSLNNITGNIMGINPNGVTANITSTGTKNNFTLTVTPATVRNFNGGNGDNIYTINTNTDTGTTIITENPVGGNDTISFLPSTTPVNVNLGVTTIQRVSPTLNLILESNVPGVTIAIENIIGGSGADNIIGNSLNNSIVGFVGADNVDGGAGTDTLQLAVTSTDLNAATDDRLKNVEIVSAPSAATPVTIDLRNQTEGFIIGGSANADTITGSKGADTINGGDGNDVLDSFGGGLDSLSGGKGDDVYGIYNSANIILENTNEGTDSIWTAVSYVMPANVEYMYLVGDGVNGTGNAGDNVIIGYGAGNNSISGGDGNDYLNGGEGNDTINGGDGNDVLDSSGGGLNNLSGGKGDDVYGIYNSANIILENTNEGTDSIWTAVSYVMPANVEYMYLVGDGVNGTGNAGDNVIIGYGAGNNSISGGDGNDALYGGDGNDIIDGGAGNDTLFGDAGADAFVFGGNNSTSLGQIGIDTISDFTVNTDKIWLSKTTFGLTEANNTPLAASNFEVVTTDLGAGDSSAAIAYNSSNGKLFYNQNGALGGFGGGGQFARLASGLNLTANDFQVIA